MDKTNSGKQKHNI